MIAGCIRRWAALVCCTVTLAVPQPRPTERNELTAFTINGVLIGGTGDEVFLLDEAGLIVNRAVAGVGGRFQFTTNDPGRYRLALRRNGQLWAVTELAVTSAQPTITVEPIGPGSMLTPQRRAEKPEAMVSIGRLQRKIPASARKLYAQAVGRGKHGDVTKAMTQLEKALTLAPDYLEAVNDLAALHLRQKNYDRAEPLLRRAMEIDPSSWQVRLNLGILQLNRGAYAEARQELEKSQLWEPGSPLPAFHLGRLCFIEGRLQEADEYFTRAMETGPGIPEAQLFRGYARLRSGRLQEGKEDLIAYLKGSPNAEDAAEVRQYLKKIDGLISPARSSPSKEPTVGVLLRFERPPTVAFVGHLRDEVGRIFRPTGLHLRWESRPANNTSEYNLVVVVEMRGRCGPETAYSPTPAPPGPLRLGWTVVTDGEVIRHTGIDCDGISQAVPPTRGGMPALLLVEQMYWRLVGRVMAHELMHALLRRPGHDNTDCARPVIAAYDLHVEPRLHPSEIAALRNLWKPAGGQSGLFPRTQPPT